MPKNNMRIIYIIGVIIGIFLIFLLSWLPNPDIGEVLPFPFWVKKWTNDNMNLRTAIPFLFLGFFCEMFIAQNRKGTIARVWALGILTLIIMVAEIGQLWLPMRHFDWGDIGYGIAGATIGLGIGIVVVNLISIILRSSNTK